MAIPVTPTNVQKLEYNVTTPEGDARVTVVTGMLAYPLYTYSGGGIVTQNASFRALVDPTTAPGQFRKAVATASLRQIGQTNGPTYAQWFINEVQATLDDETGSVQLVVDLSLSADGGGVYVYLNSIDFQVTTLAMI